MKREAVKGMARKLSRSAGFTLAETLMTILILLMVAGTVAGGIPAAMNAYRNAVDAANAQMLLSTTINALRDELSTAWDVEINGTTITYQSSDTGGKSKIELKDGKIMLQEYVKESGQGWLEAEVKTGTERLLVSDAMTKGLAKDMAATYTGAEAEKENGRIAYIKIKGLEVKRGETVTAKMPDVSESDKGVLLIRVLTGGEAA